MDTLQVATKDMTPGFSNDCGVEGCMGVEGGLCGNLTLRSSGFVLWCCELYASFCWAAPKPDCRFDVRNFSVGPLIPCEVFADEHYQWCCDGTSEVCAFTDAPYRCLDYSYANPVRHGPISGLASAPISTFSLPSTTSAIPTAVESMDTSPTVTPQPVATSKSPPLPLGGAVALGAAGLLVIVAAAVGVRYLWKRSARLQSDSQPRVELAAHWDLTPPQELRAAASLQELHGVARIPEEAGIHELGTGKADKNAVSFGA